MSKKIFTEQEILELSKNKYVKNVTAKGITYTNEFKLQFIAEYENGKTSRAIFEDAGFDVNIIGIKRIDSARLRWRKAYNDKGILGLEDTRTLNSGRTLNRELTIEEIIAKKDAEIEYLKAELELIKKLELQERQVINKKIPASKIFRLIQNLIQSLNEISYNHEDLMSVVLDFSDTYIEDHKKRILPYFNNPAFLQQSVLCVREALILSVNGLILAENVDFEAILEGMGYFP